LHYFSPSPIEIFFVFFRRLGTSGGWPARIGASTAVAAAEAGEMSASFFRFLPPPSKSTAALAAFSRSFSSFSACRSFLCDASLFLEFASRLLRAVYNMQFYYRNFITLYV
jgi:hypothetical protein